MNSVNETTLAPRWLLHKHKNVSVQFDIGLGDSGCGRIQQDPQRSLLAGRGGAGDGRIRRGRVRGGRIAVLLHPDLLALHFAEFLQRFAPVPPVDDVTVVLHTARAARLARIVHRQPR